MRFENVIFKNAVKHLVKAQFNILNRAFFFIIPS
jgi:hypothetical protein